MRERKWQDSFTNLRKMNDGCSKVKDEEMRKRVELEKQLEVCKREIESMEQAAKTWKERAFKEKDALKKMLELWGTKIERELASLEWVVTPSGGKYHVHDCNHAKGSGRKYLPCKDCVHGAIRGVIELSRRTIQ